MSNVSVKKELSQLQSNLMARTRFGASKKNLFDTGVVRAIRVDYRARSRSIIWPYFFIFFKIKVCCVYSLESPHRGDSNEYTQYTIINIKRQSPEIIPNAMMSAAMGICL